MVSEVFLGIIALATLTTAIVEFLAIVWLARTARRTWRAIDRLSRQASLIHAHATAIGDTLTRALSLAGAQLDRVASAYAIVAGPLERVATAVAVARGVSRVLGRRSSRRSRRAPSPPTSS